MLSYLYLRNSNRNAGYLLVQLRTHKLGFRAVGGHRDVTDKLRQISMPQQLSDCVCLACMKPIVVDISQQLGTDTLV